MGKILYRSISGKGTAESNDERHESHNDFHFDGTEFGKGVHYTCLDYVPVSDFTPLSGVDWWRVDKIKGQPCIRQNCIDITVECIKCGAAEHKKDKFLRIEVISFDRNLFRIRFNPYAKSFSDYDDAENSYGPISRPQLDWIQKQNTAKPDISYDGSEVIITLKCIVMTFDEKCSLTVRNRESGQILHRDGWVTPPGMNEDSQPRGIVFVDEGYGSAVAAIKKLPRDKNGIAPGYYGCGACQNYYEKGDEMRNHSSSLSHTEQVVTFFNYDNYNGNQPELQPKGLPEKLKRTEQEFIPQYVTTPFFIEYASDCSYAYGLLLDNTSQSYINLGSKIFSGATDPEYTKNISNVYYFGAQYPELDYYLIFPSSFGHSTGLIASVLDNCSILTGREYEIDDGLNQRGAMPPKYIFGLFQGVYGFSALNGGEKSSVKSVVNGYKKSDFPLEGLAIDVDVQNDFEVFTTNPDFWEGGEVGAGDSVFEWAHKQDLVCQTNITNFIRNDKEDYSVYKTLKEKDLYVKCSKFVECGGEYNTYPTKTTAYQAILPYTHTTAVFPDFSRADAAEWWGRNYWDEEQIPRPLLKIGLDFVCQDMTEPAQDPHCLGESLWNSHYAADDFHLTSGKFNWKSFHGQQLYGDPRHPGKKLPFIALRNFHGYMECKATYEYGLTVKDHYPTHYNRSYIISRGGYFGQAHYGGLWTGDNSSSWHCMQTQLPRILNLGICGFPVVGADVGGFSASDNIIHTYNHCQEKLMVRWVQAASLLPWFRDHYKNFIYCDKGKNFQELYRFDWSYRGTGRKFSDIMNDFMKLRIRFHHILYSSMFTFCKTGLPPVKPTCLFDGGCNDNGAMKGFRSCQDSQFFIGDCTVMVAPAIEDENCGELTDHRSSNYPSTIFRHPIWLPANVKWFPYNARFDGPCDPKDAFHYTQGDFGFYKGEGVVRPFTVPLEIMPIFVREGAILPTRIAADGKVKNIQQLDKDDDPFVFDIWPGSDHSSYQCYFDDGGKTRNAELNGEYSVITVEQISDGNSWQVVFTCCELKYQLPAFLYIRLRAAVSGRVSDSLGRGYVHTSNLSDLFNLKDAAFYYDEKKQEEWIKVQTNCLNGLRVCKDKSSTIHQLVFPDNVIG